MFAGTRSIGKAFEERGHEVFSVEWNKDFENIDLYKDIGELTAQEVLEKFGHPDVIHLSPDCSSYSIAGISHHRRKNSETGNLDPVSDYAKFCDKVNQHCLELIKELKPTYWFIENPRGGLRKMSFMQEVGERHTVTYCFSGNTKIITNKGHKKLNEIVNEEIFVLNINNEWEKAKVRCYGKDKLYKLTLSRYGKTKEIYTTKEHLWYAAKGYKDARYQLLPTHKLKQKMKLPYAIPKKANVEILPEYVCRGFVYGDGWVLKNTNKGGAFCQFVNEKQEMLKYFEGFGGKRWHDDKGDNSIVKLCSLPIEWKLQIPTLNNSPSEIFSWIAGYLAADGSCSNTSGQVTISSSKKCDLKKLKELAEYIGIATLSIVKFNRIGLGKEETPIYQLTFSRADFNDKILLRSQHKKAYNENLCKNFKISRWTIKSIEETDIVDYVYCCETEETHTFTLEDNIVTHNCQYEQDKPVSQRRMKPTDIFTNHPNPKFKPPCKNGDPCHVAAPRGSRTGTQGIKGSILRSVIPHDLCYHIATICEEAYDNVDLCL